MPDDTINKALSELSSLSRSDPAAFEQRRRQIIDDYIAGFPEDLRQRAHGWQFRLDHELRRHKDPVSRMNAMIELFWDGFARFQRAVHEPERLLKERDATGTVIVPLHQGDSTAAGPFCPLRTQVRRTTEH